ncbi:MAG TPA: PHP domain-containing protein [Candidatus Cloacimonadota bacterium]|nr:PHP domain-containing protein [Candidatus Cloacimonadota bacterium]
MRWYKADLHVHSVLSPCGSLEMSPREVMRTASERGLEIIAMTDHNSSANSLAYAKAAQEFDLAYIYGIEVQTAEEIHIIALFDNYEQVTGFGNELYDSLLPIDNDPDFFGDQVVIDENDNILRFEKKALINSSVWTLETAFQKISHYGGFYFPAHVDVISYSLLGQLGFIPTDIQIEALGITAKCDTDKLLKQYPQLQEYALIRNSDAHYLKDIASGFTQFYLHEPTLDEIRLACRNLDGRKIKI